MKVSKIVYSLCAIGTVLGLTVYAVAPGRNLPNGPAPFRGPSAGSSFQAQPFRGDSAGLLGRPQYSYQGATSWGVPVDVSSGRNWNRFSGGDRLYSYPYDVAAYSGIWGRGLPDSTGYPEMEQGYRDPTSQDLFYRFGVESTYSADTNNLFYGGQQAFDSSQYGVTDPEAASLDVIWWW